MEDLNRKVREFIDATQEDDFHSMDIKDQELTRKKFFENYIKRDPSGYINKSYSGLMTNDPNHATYLRNVIMGKEDIDDFYLSDDPLGVGSIEQVKETSQVTEKQPDQNTTIPSEKVDKETGASILNRLKMSAIPSGQNNVEKLKTLRKFFPNARMGKDDKGNFVGFEFINPQTNQWTRMNPEGFDVGDIVEFGRSFAGMIGEAVGGFGGAIAGGGVASVPGAVVGAGLGNASAKDLYSRGVSLLTGTPLDERTVQNYYKGLGYDYLEGAAFRYASPFIGKALNKSIRWGIGGGKKAVSNLTNALKDLEEIGEGAFATIGSFTQGKGMLMVEDFLSKIPGGAGRMSKVARRANLTIEKRMNQLARKYGAIKGVIDPYKVGTTIQEGIGSGVKRAKSGFEKAYENLGKMFKKDELFAVPNYLNSLKKFVRPEQFKGTKLGQSSAADRSSLFILEKEAREEIADKTVSIVKRNMKIDPITFADEGLGAFEKVTGKAAYREALKIENFGDLQGINFASLRAIRTFLGQKMTSRDFITDPNRGAYKDLWKELTKDMRVAVATKGEKALKRFDRVTRKYNELLKETDNVFNKIKNNFEPVKVFEAFEKNAYGEAAEYLKTVKSKLTFDEFKIVQSAIVKRLGRPSPAVREEIGALDDVLNFNLLSFSRNYLKMGEDARKVLFGDAGLRKSLDAISRHATRIKLAAKEFANPSGTAKSAIGAGGITLGLVAGAGSVGTGQGGTALSALFRGMVAVGGLSNVASRILTNPKRARWLAKGATVKPQGFAAWIGSAVKEADDIQSLEDVQQIINFFTGISESTPQTTEGYGRKMQQMKSKLLNKRPSNRSIVEGTRKEKEKELLKKPNFYLMGIGTR